MKTGAPARRRTGVWAQLWSNPAARIGLFLVLLLAACAILADVIAPGDPSALGPADSLLQAPSRDHPLGTDLHGRDVLTRLIHGSRVSLIVGWVAVIMAMAVGTAVGLAAGMGPALVDRALMGLTDLFLAFPKIFLILLLVSLTAPSLLLVIAVIGLTGWMNVARLVRAEVLSLRERDFVAAARGLGMGWWRLTFRHILPNVVPVVVVAATLRIGNTIVLESFLSFLGLGPQEPTISWGAMIEQGSGYLLDGWWLATFPGVAITLTVVGYNLVGDGLRDALDPRSLTEGSGNVRTPASRG